VIGDETTSVAMRLESKKQTVQWKQTYSPVTKAFTSLLSAEKDVNSVLGFHSLYTGSFSSERNRSFNV
jgi:hypothetical protein